MPAMSARINRRDFLHLSAGLAGAAAVSHLGSGVAMAAPEDPLFRISLAEWSLHKALFGKKLDHLDFARTAKEEFGIDAIEYVNQFFKDKAQDASYIGEMKQRCADLGVRSLLIMVDNEGHLGDPDDAQRKQAVENHKKWVEAAAGLGCHSVRVNAASEGTWHEQLALAADGLHKLTLFAEQHQLNVIVENHGGLSSNGKWLSAVMRRVDHPHCGTLPDFGNFLVDREKKEWYDVYQGVEELMPFAQAVSAKSYDFDDAKPLVTIEKDEQREIDFLKMMKIVIAAGYHGYVGIEYEGGELDEYEGIRRTKAILEKVREELSA
jgi:sugar phosphate isomerase/epimerase